ncbi:unnamed protein product [Protopolystoma xenopodis]|uniref:Uncharacterized protein n=1 Tax=Protopolystoma xenopodis TaxID=117903 RepID=A0A3S5ARN9_9PLAT|nr:unnamed protein product [Protopolystoma xenopodis]
MPPRVGRRTGYLPYGVSGQHASLVYFLRLRAHSPSALSVGVFVLHFLCRSLLLSCSDALIVANRTVVPSPSWLLKSRTGRRQRQPERATVRWAEEWEKRLKSTNVSSNAV